MFTNALVSSSLQHEWYCEPSESLKVRVFFRVCQNITVNCKVLFHIFKQLEQNLYPREIVSFVTVAWAAEAFFTPGQSSITPEDRLWVKRRSSYESSQTHNQSSKGAILTLPWRTTKQDRFRYLFAVADRFSWIKFDVWLKKAFF